MFKLLLQLCERMAVLALLAIAALLAQTAFAHPLTFHKNPVPGFPVLNVVCRGSTKECPSGDTCCPRAGKDDFGCCPKLNAVCCADQKHCCPEGYTCDKGDGQCLKDVSSTHPLIALGDPSDVVGDVTTITCDDGRMCPSNDTCCLVSSGSYGCCPSPNAVCCADMKHCCKTGHKCDNATGKCVDNASAHPLLELVSTRPLVGLEIKSEVGNVVCPDKSDTCPDGDTCCTIAGGKEGCCPHENALCCPDQKHCCPEGFSCGTSGKACTRGELEHPLVELVRPQSVLVRPQSVLCPDNVHECPDAETCCLVQGGTYGCCPKPDAVCCSDMVHCCPKGTTCGATSCDGNGLVYHPLIKLAGQS